MYVKGKRRSVHSLVDVVNGFACLGGAVAALNGAGAAGVTATRMRRGRSSHGDRRGLRRARGGRSSHRNRRSHRRRGGLPRHGGRKDREGKDEVEGYDGASEHVGDAWYAAGEAISVVRRVLFELRSCNIVCDTLYLSVRPLVAQGAEDSALPIVEFERGSAKQCHRCQIVHMLALLPLN